VKQFHTIYIYRLELRLFVKYREYYIPLIQYEVEFYKEEKNMKQKVIAAFLTAIMTLTSLVIPVLAQYDLGDYPAPFASGGSLDVYVVVGADAASADVVGAVDLAARLAGESYQEVSSSGVGVTGGKTEEIPLDSALNAAGYFGSTLDDNDIPGLSDTQITITSSSGSEEYDVHEEIQLTSGIELETGLTNNNPDEDFTDKAFLEVDKDSVKYCYVFDDNLDSGYFFNDSSSDYPIEIEFLGSTLTITGADANSLTAQVGDKELLASGESITLGGQTVTLESTTTSKAVISCGGTTKAVSEGASATICGLEVVVDTLIDDEGTENDQAILVVGEDATKTYDSGDEYIGEDEDDPDWVWSLASLNTNNPTLCVEYDQQLDEPDEVVYMGEQLCLPGDYACIDLNSFVEDNYQDYEVELATEELYQADGSTVRVTTGYVIHWESKGGDDDGFSVGGEDTDDVALYFNASTLDIDVFFKDPDNNRYTYSSSVLNGTNAGNAFFFTFEDTNMGMYFDWNAAGSEGNMTFNVTAGDVIRINFEVSSNNRFDYLGETDSDTTTAYDLMYGSRDISGWEEDTLTETGIVIYDPDSHLSGDSFEFSINGDESDFVTNVIVTGPEGTVTAGEDAIEKVVPVTNAVAKLDSEVSLPVGKHLILVGGPGVNSKTAQAMGYTYPTYGSQMTGEEFGEGEGFVKIYEDVLEDGYAALVVAGWEAAQTRNACSVLQQYSSFADELDGNEAVKVTSVTAEGITAA
jgi:hypothetical protein